jgi:uncharacterized membrane protein YfcA
MNQVVLIWSIRTLGFFNKHSLTVAALMGVPSVLGVIVSLKLLLTSGEGFIRLVFTLLLSYTIVRLVIELKNSAEPGKLLRKLEW